MIHFLKIHEVDLHLRQSGDGVACIVGTEELPE